MENDWLGIDNKHAQAVFRSLGTRDIIGYVQITKSQNPALKDATNRQGLNEDTQEFSDFKDFIWKILDLLQEFIFSRIKTEAQKQGKVIQTTVEDIKKDLLSFKKDLPQLYDRKSSGIFLKYFYNLSFYFGKRFLKTFQRFYTTFYIRFNIYFTLTG